MSDPEAILDALAAGLSIEKAAKRFHLPVAEVRRILKDEVERCRDGEHLREVWALADRRLAAVEVKFYNKALEGDGDPQSAIVFVKTSERRATLADANKPIGHAVTIMTATAPPYSPRPRNEAGSCRARGGPQLPRYSCAGTQASRVRLPGAERPARARHSNAPGIVICPAFRRDLVDSGQINFDHDAR